MRNDDATTGMDLARAGRFGEALPYLEAANRQAPTDIALLHAVASLLQSSGRGRDAVSRYRVAAELLPENVAVFVGLGRSLMLLGELDQATLALSRALTIDPAIAAPGGMLGMIWNDDDPDAACVMLRELAHRHPANAALTLQSAQALQAAEYLDESRTAFEQYHKLRPGDPLALIELGRLAAGRGESAAAMAHFNAAKTLDSHHARAIAEIAQAERNQLDQATLHQVLAMADAPRSSEDAIVLNDLLARHYDHAGDYPNAALHIGRMNTLQEQMTPPAHRYDPCQHELEVDVAIANQTTHFFNRLRDAGNPDRRPVFIIGLPRSGTTLLERMLAAHPGIVGVGEQTFARNGFQRALAATGGMQESLEAGAVADAAGWHLQMLEDRLQRHGITGQPERIVDKLPDNYLLAGWLRIAFPNAAIIHCLRDPRDVALSCWQTQFAKVGWSLRLEHIAHRIEQHRRLMRHWRSTIGDGLIELRYEHLVATPERELRRTLDVIGLHWHPDMLDFAERKGYVGSASRHQVRESLHARSVERWRNYEPALRPILLRLTAIAAADASESNIDTTK